MRPAFKRSLLLLPARSIFKCKKNDKEEDEEQNNMHEDEQVKHEKNEDEYEVDEDEEEEEACTYKVKSRSQGKEPHMVGYSQESLKSLKYWSLVMLLILCKYCSCHICWSFLVVPRC